MFIENHDLEVLTFYSSSKQNFHKQLQIVFFKQELLILYFILGISYAFSLHICDANSGNIIKIIDADLLGPQRLRWPCAVQATQNDKCYILDTMTSGKYFNGQWQKHWSRVLEIGQDGNNAVTELFQLDSEAETMAMTKQVMIISANGDILFVDLSFLFKQAQQQQPQHQNGYDHSYQNLP